ncbi:MAG: Gldg family protein [Chloroflexi bacterium]|nr:Gldg family protein [Chloroflexota bacterium]
MRAYLALFRKDLKSYFDQPTGYILLILFVTSLAVIEFYNPVSINGIPVGSALNSGEASALPLMHWLPWILMLIAPVATMRLLAEEVRDGTLELLLTQPLRTWTVILSKFSAGLSFITFGILMTLIIPLTLFSAGDVDGGTLSAQYIGAVFLAASLVAVGLFASSLTRSQVVPAIVAIFIIGILLIIGHPNVALRLPSNVARLLQDLSPLSHFLNMARGTLDVRDVLYFVALTGTFLSGTYLMVRGRTLSHHSPVYRNLRLGVLGFLIVSILVGWFGNSIGGRWDLTEDKRFTLSSASEDILADLDDLLTINLYLSQDPPVQLAATTRDVRQFLADFASKSDKVRLVEQFPKSSDEADSVTEEAAMAGVTPKQFNLQTDDELQVKTGWLGVSMTYVNQRRVVPFIDTIDGLEYRVSALANAMIREERDTIAFLSGHGEKVWSQEMRIVASQLAEQYDLAQVQPDTDGNLNLAGVDVLIVPGPIAPLSNAELDTLDAFLAGGGKAMFLVDTSAVDRTSLQLRSTATNLPRWLNRYGVFVHNTVALDPQSNTDLSFTTAQGNVLIPYPYWVVLPVSQRDISGAVESMMLPWAASVEFSNPLIATNVIRHIELMRTFPSAALQFEFGDVSPRTSIAQYNIDPASTGQHLMGAAVEGTAINAPPLDSGELPAYRMIVIGDADWLTDTVIQQSGGDFNIVVALNWIDWLAQDESLSSIRSKVVVERSLRWTNDGHKNAVQYGTILGLPLALLLFGTFRFIKRRNTSLQVFEREQ